MLHEPEATATSHAVHGGRAAGFRDGSERDRREPRRDAPMPLLLQEDPARDDPQQRADVRPQASRHERRAPNGPYGRRRLLLPAQWRDVSGELRERRRRWAGADHEFRVLRLRVCERPPGALGGQSGTRKGHRRRAQSRPT